MDQVHKINDSIMLSNIYEFEWNIEDFLARKGDEKWFSSVFCVIFKSKLHIILTMTFHTMKYEFYYLCK